MRAHFRPALFVSLIAFTLTLFASPAAFAQARAVPRPVARPVGHPVGRVVVGVGVPYGGWYGPGFGFGFGFGVGYPWYGYWPYGYYGYGPWYGWAPYAYPPYPYPYAVDDRASLRIDAKPRQADVYVDGYRVGSVDDFDGTFQRLHLQPGKHELVLYLAGYHTITQHLDLEPFASSKITMTMVKLDANEPMDPPPAPANPSTPDPTELRHRGYGVKPETGDVGQNFGTLSIRVLPLDAEIYVDGERWTMPEHHDRLTVQLADGKHKLEVRKEGFEKYTADVQVHRGETTTLNVSLLR